VPEAALLPVSFKGHANRALRCLTIYGKNLRPDKEQGWIWAALTGSIRGIDKAADVSIHYLKVMFTNITVWGISRRYEVGNGKSR